MDDDERREIMERAYAALEDTAGIEQRIEARKVANREGRLLGKSGWRAPEPPAPIPPVQRPQGPPNREAEAVYIRQLAAEVADQRIEAIVSQRIETLLEGIGIALGETRDELRNETLEAIMALRREFETMFGANADQIETGKGIRQIARGLNELQQLLRRLELDRVDTSARPN